jgi:hypothetical protein
LAQRVASHPRSAAKAHHTTTSEHMPPAHQAMAKRTPDKLRTEAAALGLAIGTYVDRLLGARESWLAPSATKPRVAGSRFTLRIKSF